MQILLGKYYPYTRKCNGKLPSLNGFTARLKRVLSIELYIARRRNKLISHHKKWENRLTTLTDQLPITRTVANSNQNQFPLDFRHTFTVILPSVTRTLDNSNLPLTRSNFHFPSGHFLYNFTLNNSNHVCRYVTSRNKQCTVVENVKVYMT